MNYFILRNRIGIYFFNLFAKLKGFNFKVAETKEEINQAYHLRWKVYAEEGYINPDDYPEKNFIDKYDPASVNFLAFYKEQIVGTVRLTFNSDAGIPTLNNFHIDLPVYLLPDELVEVGRFAIDKNYRGKRRIVSFGLSSAFYIYSLENRVRWLIVHMPEKLRRAFKNFGVDFKILPEKPLLDHHIKSRGVIAGYFEKHHLKPMLADIHMISAW